MDIVHCIGDSHSCFFYGQDKIIGDQLKSYQSLIPHFRVYHIGPALAYNLGNLNSTTQSREKVLELLGNTIPKHSQLLFCFGEIDCRFHILKQAEERKRPLNEIISDCVNRYVRFLSEIRDMGYPVAVWGVIATAHDSVPMDAALPRMKSCIERNQLTRQFNNELAKAAKENQIQFVSIFDHLVNKDDTSRMEFYMDDIHLSQAAMPLAIEELNKILSTNMPTTAPTLSRLYLNSNPTDGWSCLPDDNIHSYSEYLKTYTDSTVDEVFTDQLQSLPNRSEVVSLLKEIHRVLKPSGIFRLSTPNLMSLCRLFTHSAMPPDGQHQVMEIIYGQHSTSAGLNHIGFTPEFIRHYLTSVGFRQIRFVNEFKDFKAQSDFRPFGVDNIMLNVEAIK